MAKRKILVVDDEPKLRELLEEVLQARGYDVVSVADGQSALAEFDRWRPDAVVLDYRLPGMDGLAVLEAIKQRSVTTPVIMITGFDTLAVDQEAMRLGALEILEKPFEVPVLYWLLRSAFEGRKRPVPPIPEEQLSGVGSGRRSGHETSSRVTAPVETEDLLMLVGGVAHELRNELTTVALFMRRLRRGLAPEKADVFFDAIDRGLAQSLLSLRRLLVFVRLGGTLRERVEVSALIDWIKETIKPRLPSNVDLRIIQDTSVAIVTNAELLQVVLNELIQNSAKAVLDKSGLIEIGFRSDGDSLTISVKDNGGGIPADLRNRLFKEQVRSSGVGLGLGLFLCGNAIANLGGQLVLQETGETGTAVAVILPLTA